MCVWTDRCDAVCMLMDGWWYTGEWVTVGGWLASGMGGWGDGLLSVWFIMMMDKWMAWLADWMDGFM
jgi:hypothetical protein